VIRRLIQALTTVDGGTNRVPLRPNQLRRDDAIAERRRQEAARRSDRPGAQASQTRPNREAANPPRHESPGSLPAALSSRAGLRQAMLLREVIGPPLSLRDQESGRVRF